MFRLAFLLILLSGPAGSSVPGWAVGLPFLAGPIDPHQSPVVYEPGGSCEISVEVCDDDGCVRVCYPDG